MSEASAIRTDAAATFVKAMEAPTTLQIDGKSRDGQKFLLSCGCGTEFVQPRSSISAECPGCGETALMTDLALDFHCNANAA